MPDNYHSPFVNNTKGVINITFHMMFALTTLAILFSLVVEPYFFVRYASFVFLGLALEMAYFLLKDGTFKIKSGSSMITAAILILSIPTNMPFIYSAFALILAVIVVKLPAGENAIKLNPAIAGRFFLMLAYKDEIVSWSKKGSEIHSLSTATPLELFHGEGAVTPLINLLTGNISGNYEGLYELVNGSPGDSFGLIIIIIGIILWYRGILDIRPALIFIFSFAISMFFIGDAVVFNIFSGALIFSAFFIATDPKSTPVTPIGKYIAAIIAGITNALIRKYTYYSEGIVFSFLIANLLTPVIDNIVFYLRSRNLLKKSLKKSV